MRCCGTVGVLKVMRKVFVFLLPPESSLTEMLKMSWRCLISLTVSVAVFMALSMRNGDSAVPDRLTD